MLKLNVQQKNVMFNANAFSAEKNHTKTFDVCQILRLECSRF